MLDDTVTWVDRFRIKVSIEKRKLKAMNHTDPLSLSQVQLNHIDNFIYLDPQICFDGSSDANIYQRFQKAYMVFDSLRRPLWSRRETSVGTNV